MKRLETQQINAYKKLEKRGLVVSSTTLTNTMAELEARIDQRLNRYHRTNMIVQ